MTNFNGEFGIDAIKRVLSAIFKNAKLDRNGNGQIDAQEWASAAFSLLPALLTPDLINEIKDVKKPEFREIFQWIAIYFPEHAEFKPQVEAVVSAVFTWADSSLGLYTAVLDLQKAPTAEPVIPATPASPKNPKVRGGATKQEVPVLEDPAEPIPSLPTDPPYPVTEGAITEGANPSGELNEPEA